MYHQAGAQSGSCHPQTLGVCSVLGAKPMAERKKVTRTMEMLSLLTLRLPQAAKGTHRGCLEPVKGFNPILPSPLAGRET